MELNQAVVVVVVINIIGFTAAAAECLVSLVLLLMPLLCSNAFLIRNKNRCLLFWNVENIDEGGCNYLQHEEENWNNLKTITAVIAVTE